MINVEEIKKALEGVTSAFNRVLAEAPADADHFSIGFDCQGQAIRIDLADMRTITELLTKLEALHLNNVKQERIIAGMNEQLTEQYELSTKYVATSVSLEAEVKRLREALEPFVSAFESRRESYSKRYPADRDIGYANFDKMPDDWAMETIFFKMADYRRASTALASAGEHHAE